MGAGIEYADTAQITKSVDEQAKKMLSDEAAKGNEKAKAALDKLTGAPGGKTALPDTGAGGGRGFVNPNMPSEAGAGRGSINPTMPTETPTNIPEQSTNIGQRLNSAISQNTDLKLNDLSPATSTAVTNNTSNSMSKPTPVKQSLPPVRNQEETFQRMIFNSTRVV